MNMDAVIAASIISGDNGARVTAINDWWRTSVGSCHGFR